MTFLKKNIGQRRLQVAVRASRRRGLLFTIRANDGAGRSELWPKTPKNILSFTCNPAPSRTPQSKPVRSELRQAGLSLALTHLHLVFLP